MDRTILFERFLDNLELYLKQTQEVQNREKELFEQEVSFADIDMMMEDAKDMSLRLKGLTQVALETFINDVVSR